MAKGGASMAATICNGDGGTRSGQTVDTPNVRVSSPEET